MTQFPLEGIRVINFGWVWAAPVMGHLLADFGAEVIRVESHTRPCFFRRSMPLVGDKPGYNLCGHFQNWNRNTLGITADLKRSRAIELIKKLVGKSDVVIENYPPRVMKARGLDYESLVRVKPDLVMISLPAVGQTGPLKDIMTYGPSLGSIAGFASLLGYPDGQEAAFEYCYTDTIASVTGVFLILSCLRHRNLTGEGQFVDMAQSEASTCLIGESIMEYSMNGRVMGFQGNRSQWMAPHNLYPCRGEDRWVSIAVKTDREWESFCQAIGNPSWTKDEKFADNYARRRNRKELDRLVSEWTRNQTPYEVMDILQKAGVAAMPSLDDEERCFTDPHHKARESIVDVKTPDIDQPVPIYNVPWKLSETPGKVRHCAPMLGEHNDYVYGDILGLSKEEISSLTKEKVIY